MFSVLIKQEFLLQIKNPSGLIQSIVFFMISTSIFAITTNIEKDTTAIAIIWICLTFAILLSSGQFQKDFDDGTFEQLFLSGEVFELIILNKIISNWLFNSLPLLVILPIIGLLFGLANNLIINLSITAIIASVIINFLVSFGSSLTLSSNQTSALLTVLILPLLIPIIIFANLALGGDFAISIKFLLAILIFLAPILTYATAAAIRTNVVD
ncbi:MAG: heme exporter protein B [Rickettsiales bacterium]|jgi:heme exporter protein B